MKYTFITDDGVQSLTYKQYLSNKRLRKQITNLDNYRLFLGQTIISYTGAFLKGDVVAAKNFFAMEKAQKENPLQFFAPSGEEAKAFINDYDHSVTGLYAGNRFGKTTSAFIKVLVNTIPCDPNWRIFTEHGIDYKKWRKPKVIAIGSYEWGNHKTTIWPQVVRKWVPASELGEYAYGGSRRISWKDIPPRIELKCGSVICFYCYSQDQAAFESQAVDIWLWDEQGHETLFDGANERCRTLNGWHTFSLTPHKLPGRPDTGAGSWITKLASGQTTKGHHVRFYTGNLIESVPDWIYPEKQKAAAIAQWVTEPTEHNDVKTLREGRARLFGEPHQSSGLVYDEWDPKVHLIDPFEIPRSWPRYRALDYGRRNATTCLFGACNPNGDLILYDEYYKTDRTIYENIHGMHEKDGIIAASGNTLEKLPSRQSDTGIYRERWVETGPMRYRATVLDSRSYATPDPTSHMTLSQLFNLFGLRVTPSSGKNCETTIPMVKEWLRVDYNKKHAFTLEPGAPRVYVFRTLSNFRREMTGYVNEETSSKKLVVVEKPRQGDDHMMDAFRYMIQIPPIFVDDEWGEEVKKKKKIVDKYTGY